jgi:hypothetical protein
METQQKWFIPHELSAEDAEGVIREIEAYIDEHPNEADDYWLVDYNDEDIFAKSFPKEEIDKAAAHYQIPVFEVMMDIMREQNGVTKQKSRRTKK